MKPECVVLFGKRLQVGQVKTRLAAEVGADRALAMYRMLVDEAAHLQLVDRWDAVWCLTGDGAWPWEGRVWEQVEGDLGDRMEAAVERAFEEGAERVVVVGTDVPEIGEAVVGRMFDALRSGVQVVTVPVRDGGYGAIGLRQRPGDLFLGKSWSHPRVHEQALVAAASRGMRICALPCLSDVDDAADWERWLASLTERNQRDERIDGDLERGRSLLA